MDLCFSALLNPLERSMGYPNTSAPHLDSRLKSTQSALPNIYSTPRNIFFNRPPLGCRRTYTNFRSTLPLRLFNLEKRVSDENSHVGKSENKVNSEANVDSLTPSTFRVYLIILKNSQLTLTDLANKTGWTKPTLLHHLNKLVKLELVQQIEDRYEAVKKVDIGVLCAYASVAGRIIPRYLIYAVFYTILLCATIVINIPLEAKVMTIILCLVNILVSIFEVRKYQF